MALEDWVRVEASQDYLNFAGAMLGTFPQGKRSTGHFLLLDNCESLNSSSQPEVPDLDADLTLDLYLEARRLAFCLITPFNVSGQEHLSPHHYLDDSWVFFLHSDAICCVMFLLRGWQEGSG